MFNVVHETHQERGMLVMCYSISQGMGIAIINCVLLTQLNNVQVNS